MAAASTMHKLHNKMMQQTDEYSLYVRHELLRYFMDKENYLYRVESRILDYTYTSG